mgnify:CR=1 FL=1
MTTFEKIMKALRPFGYPCVRDVYEGGESDRWFTYNYADDYGDGYSDDEPGFAIVSVQIHFFLPWKEEFIHVKNKIRKALLDQDFTFPEVTVLLEKDTGIRHLIFECETEEEVSENRKEK